GVKRLREAVAESPSEGVRVASLDEGARPVVRLERLAEPEGVRDDARRHDVRRRRVDGAALGEVELAAAAEERVARLDRCADVERPFQARLGGGELELEVGTLARSHGVLAELGHRQRRTDTLDILRVEALA